MFSVSLHPTSALAAKLITTKVSLPNEAQMPDVWLDTVTPKISIAIHSLLPSLHAKGYSTLVTAKRQTQTTDMLNALKVPFETVGEYGTTLKEKLAFEQKRTLEFLELFEKVGYPKVLWTHGDVSAIRTAFGLNIPIVYANDTVFAYHVAKLACPLVNWLVAPLCFGKSWSKFGISKSKIVHYDGLEELAWLKGTEFEQPKFLQELASKKPIILFRDAEYQAAYFRDSKIDTQKLLRKLTELATVVYLPRYEDERDKLKDVPNLWISSKPVLTAQLIPYIDVMVGSGGTACRETAFRGIPTVNFHFWDVQARYLRKKGFPIQIIRNPNKVLQHIKKILKIRKTYREHTERLIEKLESPIPCWNKYIEICLKKKPN
jgi:predicted glycosyltransferase